MTTGEVSTTAPPWSSGFFKLACAPEIYTIRGVANDKGLTPIDWVLAAGFVALHAWAVLLNFQVNGLTAWGWIMGFFTLGMPILSDLAWAWWALAHGHPFGYATLVYAAVVMLYAAIYSRK